MCLLSQLVIKIPTEKVDKLQFKISWLTFTKSVFSLFLIFLLLFPSLLFLTFYPIYSLTFLLVSGDRLLCQIKLHFELPYCLLVWKKGFNIRFAISKPLSNTTQAIAVKGCCFQCSPWFYIIIKYCFSYLSLSLDILRFHLYYIMNLGWFLLRVAYLWIIFSLLLLYFLCN